MTRPTPGALCAICQKRPAAFVTSSGMDCCGQCHAIGGKMAAEVKMVASGMTFTSPDRTNKRKL